MSFESSSPNYSHPSLNANNKYIFDDSEEDAIATQPKVEFSVSPNDPSKTSDLLNQINTLDYRLIARKARIQNEVAYYQRRIEDLRLILIMPSSTSQRFQLM